ncbi:hypothetical protein AB0L75_05760 [Streptomyces sp. NPDC052101]|uniref:hypothetical protein n=1 Tax=Streptomyces sp. NPDC052101 TaxID=3155763 RepID=UPI00342A232E
MSSIRRAVACTAASVLLSVGGLAVAAPAQAQDEVPAATAQQSAPTGGLGGLLGNGNGNDNGNNCGLLGLGCLLHGVLGIL